MFGRLFLIPNHLHFFLYTQILIASPVCQGFSWSPSLANLTFPSNLLWIRWVTAGIKCFWHYFFQSLFLRYKTELSVFGVGRSQVWKKAYKSISTYLPWFRPSSSSKFSSSTISISISTLSMFDLQFSNWREE